MTKGGVALPSGSLLCSNRSRLKRSPFPLSSRAYPDFLLAALERPACAVFCKENRMEFATSPTLTGNPGQPRDLQFAQPATTPYQSAPLPLCHPDRSAVERPAVLASAAGAPQNCMRLASQTAHKT